MAEDKRAASAPCGEWAGTQRNAVGRQRPPLDGELSPHEEPSEKAKAKVQPK